MSELKACPFCGSSFVEISRYGNSRVSTFYQCNDCGVSLETGETFNHGEQWNNRPHENKIKAGAVREAVKYMYKECLYLDSSPRYALDEYAEMLERGEL